MWGMWAWQLSQQCSGRGYRRRLIDGLFSNDAVMQNKRRNKMVESDTIASAPREKVQLTQNVEITDKMYLGMCFEL